MSSKYSSRATKMILASLLAATVALPSYNTVVGAEEISNQQVQAVAIANGQVMDVEIKNDSNLSRTIKPTVTFSVNPGGKFFILNFASDSVSKMVQSVKVDGVEPTNRSGVYYVKYDETKTDYDLEIKTQYYTATGTISLKTDTVRDAEPEAEPEIVPPGLVIETSKLPDGLYNAKAAFLNANLTTIKDSSMASYLSDNAVVKIKDGKATLEVTVKFDTQAITKIHYFNGATKVVSDVVGKTAKGHNKVFSFPIDNVGNYYKVNGIIDYKASSAAASLPSTMNPIGDHDFYVKLDATTLTSKATIASYKEDADTASVMDGYMNKGAKITPLANGTFDVEMSFNAGQYVKSFKVEGKDAVLVKAHTEADKTATYKFNVATIKDYIDADIHVIVPAMPGFAGYDTEHGVRLKLTGQSIQPFTDLVDGRWYSNSVKELYAQGIYNVADKFNLSRSTKRYEFSLMLQRALKLDVPETTTFTDIQKLNPEAVEAMKALNAYGIIFGVDKAQTTFNPGGVITRQSTAVMILRLLEKAGYEVDPSLTVNYKDVKAITAKSSAFQKESYTAIAALNDLGIMVGSGGKFDPTGPLSRTQMAKVLASTLEVYNQYKGLKK